MPVINLDMEDLKRLVGDGFDPEQFMNEIPMLGATVEKEGDGEIAVEFFPNRPDLFSVEGVARAYRSFKEVRTGGMSGIYSVSGDSGMELSVDPGVAAVRPVIGAAYIKGVSIDEKVLVAIMNLQEKLHITVGRKRRKVAIGIHDAAPLASPFRYRAVRPDEISFVPLGKSGEWDLERILREHEKGIAYAWVLEGLDRYPVILDSRNRVLSFPPIINGELTRVTENTKDIFVDCTGWDLRAVSLAVNIVCSQMVSRGGTVESVKVIYPDEMRSIDPGLVTGSWPRMEWKEVSLDMDWTRSWLGRNLSGDEMINALSRMGYEDCRTDDGRLTCLVPPWRNDILHQADLAEDVAIGHGFHRFTGTVSRANTTGGERRYTTISRYIRESFVGLGFIETRTISLSNEREQFELMGRKEVPHMRIENPITTDHTMLRLSAIPSLLSLLRTNKHRDLPQRIFEIADIMVEDASRSTVCALSEDNRASFTEVKGYVQRLLRDLGVDFIPEKADLGWYIRGRGAAIMVELPEGVKDREKGPFPELEGGKMIPLGHFGEIHPRVISDYDLVTPVSALEMDMDLLLELTRI